jgi:hypothetical protein
MFSIAWVQGQAVFLGVHKQKSSCVGHLARPGKGMRDAGGSFSAQL